MFSTLELTRMARGLMAHSGDRMGLVAENLSNADTPAFKARDLPEFGTVWEEGLGLTRTRAGHLADDAGTRAIPILQRGATDPNGNSVSVEVEMARAAEIRLNHDMATAIYRATSEIVRTSLGRSR